MRSKYHTKRMAEVNFVDKSGLKQGMLYVSHFVGWKKYSDKYASLWLCKCDCGNEIEVSVLNLNRRKWHCGCQKTKKERKSQYNKTHGRVFNSWGERRAFNSWKMMWQRCTYPQHPNYHRYGGRGIQVCDRWKVFKNFFEDMGKRPENYTLDRIDSDKGYYLKNCRWASRRTQAINNTMKKKHYYWDAQKHRYLVKFRRGGEWYHFGFFRTEAAAKAQVRDALMYLDDIVATIEGVEA